MNQGGGSMAVITISRELGSFGDQIAKNVADKLNYEYADKLKIGEALAGHGFPAPEVEKYDEKKPAFWKAFSDQRKKFLHLVQAVIYDLAGKGNVVIVGRGGQVLLKDLSGTLHVRIVTPEGIRSKNLMEQEGLSAKEAERILRQSDRDSSGYIGAFFDADWNDQDLYDLVINTRIMSVDTATKMIIDVVGSPEFKESPEETAEKLADLALARKVEAVLMGFLGIEYSHLQVENRIVTLKGTAQFQMHKENCERAISEIDGVDGVNIELGVIPGRHFRYDG
jgi:cytidylate kinase